VQALAPDGPTVNVQQSTYNRRTSELPFIDLAAVSDPRHTYTHGGIIDDIYHPLVPDAYSPLLLATLQFLASTWSRFLPEGFQLRKNALNQLLGEFVQFLPRARLQFD
jgi:hypothetical protein